MLLLFCVGFLSCINSHHRKVRVHKYKFLVDGSVSYQYIFQTKAGDVDYYYWYSTTSPTSDYGTMRWVKTTINPLKGINEEDLEEDEEVDLDVADLSSDIESDVDASDGESSDAESSDAGDSGGGDGGD